MTSEGLKLIRELQSAVPPDLSQEFVVQVLRFEATVEGQKAES